MDNKKGKPKKSKLLNKYRLTIFNESKVEKKKIHRFYVSPLSVLISLFILFLLVIVVLYMIVVFTPVGKLLPGYSSRTKEEIIGNYLKIDSISREVEKQGYYIANIKTILNGEISFDSLKNMPENITTDSTLIEKTELEKRFATEWEKRERYNLTSQATNVNEVQMLNLIRPAQGKVIKAFDMTNGHYGVDIAEKPGESICAVHDGTVIMSDFTANDGFTIVIQHRENLVSVYRNCYRLMKGAGDKVLKGEAIGTFFNKEGEETRERKKFLHLELWHRGKPLDPNTYIAL